MRRSGEKSKVRFGEGGYERKEGQVVGRCGRSDERRRFDSFQGKTDRDRRCERFCMAEVIGDM